MKILKIHSGHKKTSNIPINIEQKEEILTNKNQHIRLPTHNK